MWAQIIKTRVKPGSDQELTLLMDQFKAAEQPGSGLIRSSLMRNDKDPDEIYMLVVFESEAKARARETDPRREPGLKAARETMAKIFEGAPEFLDLTVQAENTF